MAAHRSARAVGAPERQLEVGHLTARQDWPDGRTAFQVLIDTDGTTSQSHRAYWWPHDGLRIAHRSATEPTTEAGLGGELPRPATAVKPA